MSTDYYNTKISLSYENGKYRVNVQVIGSNVPWNRYTDWVDTHDKAFALVAPILAELYSRMAKELDPNHRRIDDDPCVCDPDKDEECWNCT